MVGYSLEEVVVVRSTYVDDGGDESRRWEKSWRMMLEMEGFFVGFLSMQKEMESGREEGMIKGV